MGYLHIQKCALLNQNLRSHPENLLIQRLTFTLTAAVSTRCWSNMASIKLSLRSYLRIPDVPF